MYLIVLFTFRATFTQKFNLDEQLNQTENSYC